jgi:hypothetical protein
MKVINESTNETGPRTLKVRQKWKGKSVIRCERKKNWNDKLGTTWCGVKLIQNSYNDNTKQRTTRMCAGQVLLKYTRYRKCTKNFELCIASTSEEERSVAVYTEGEGVPDSLVKTEIPPVDSGKARLHSSWYLWRKHNKNINHNFWEHIIDF